MNNFKIITEFNEKESIFEITIKYYDMTAYVHIHNPKNFTYDYDFDDSWGAGKYGDNPSAIPKEEWTKLYDAVKRNYNHDIELEQNDTILLIACNKYDNRFEISTLFKVTNKNGSYNDDMVNIILPLDKYREELLAMIEHLLNVIDKFPSKII